MYLLMSLVASIVSTIGTFTCKDASNDKVTLVVQHPDGCFLTDPSPVAGGLSTGADIVAVKPGKTVFKFDCGGKKIEVAKDVQPGVLSIKVDPETGTAQDSGLGL